ncbi:MAG: homocysteine S-methyltransferase family protein [Aliiglaciecola sp.]
MKYSLLPHQTNRLFMTDGGLETTMIFHKGLELPYFASFTLLNEPKGRDQLVDYFHGYLSVAEQHDCVMILDTPTWRANADWCELLGLDATQAHRINTQATALMQTIQAGAPRTPSIISGCIGPRYDGYSAIQQMDQMDAFYYHLPQIESLTQAGVDIISALTINYEQEAIGMVRAAQTCNVPIAISFTTETDGRLPNGSSIESAIENVDKVTGYGPAYYMINCAHPQHFQQALAAGEAWTRRIHGIRLNASKKSHAELDACETLDDGNPEELAQQVKSLKSIHQGINIVGGCCGTDTRHLSAMLNLCA